MSHILLLCSIKRCICTVHDICLLVPGTEKKGLPLLGMTPEQLMANSSFPFVNADILQAFLCGQANPEP